ncbi:hypothetical protein EVAR_67740_1 [Eumeta japonica]|uniref:Uncharacterized protein n=1 Tax=Eumeta variegata TaxID=151549 RepID=A0A4C1ZEJ2_EUMVA|nr:hypothetical protein EVAR_67740_1 [Eumeta japonica]
MLESSKVPPGTSINLAHQTHISDYKYQAGPHHLRCLQQRPKPRSVPVRAALRPSLRNFLRLDCNAHRSQRVRLRCKSPSANSSMRRDLEVRRNDPGEALAGPAGGRLIIRSTRRSRT